MADLGAHATVDASAPGWVERAREVPGGGAEVVLDGVGGELGAAALPLTVGLGRFSAHGAPSGGFAPLDAEVVDRLGNTVLGIADVRFGPSDLRRLTAHALAEAAAGRLRVVIGAVFPLAEAEAAHRAVEGPGGGGEGGPGGVRRAVTGPQASASARYGLAVAGSGRPRAAVAAARVAA
ncbi:zinc-binding dehydrogenase [Streptomyces antibioticus]|uniref:zinc-binding dehydrogenase n=1 Tax=Streptomyces antibioticus TaxID=1890 RepID=UPI003D7050F5